MSQPRRPRSEPIKSTVLTAPKKPAKIRKNIMLSPSAIAMCKSLAASERRCFSNMLEVLIDREHQRQQVRA